MTDKKITELDVATSAADADLATIVQGGVNKQIETGNLIKTDDSTIERASGTLQVKDAGIVLAKLEAALQTIMNNATLNTDTDLSSTAWLLDEDNMTSNDATKPVSQQSLVSYVSNLVAAVVKLQGDWDADTNSPDITSESTTGYAWRVSVAGSTDLGGITTWGVGDLAVKTATGWMRINSQDIAAVWGNISGTLSNQTDLQGALDAKNDAPAEGPFVDGDKTKLDHITVTQAVDLDTMESDTATNNAKVTNATHTGDVTGSGALTIANEAVTLAKLSTAIQTLLGYLNQDVKDTATPSWVGALLTALNTGDRVLTTDSSGTVQESGITAESTTLSGSVWGMVHFASIEAGIQNGDSFWLETGGKMYWCRKDSTGTVKGVEATAPVP